MQKFFPLTFVLAIFAISPLLHNPARADSPTTIPHPPLPSPALFLTLAADEIAKLPLTPQNQPLFLALARAQSLAHDLPALRKTAALIQKNEDENPDKNPALEKEFQSLTSAWLAGDFARAGDLATYRTYLAKALTHPDLHALAAAYAAAHDYPNMLKTLESANPAALRFDYRDLARQLANSDPVEARLLLKKIAQLKPFNNVPAEYSLALDYANIGDADAALTHAQSVPGPSEQSLQIFDDLASDFDNNFDRPAAKRARQRYITTFAKAPQKMRDEQRYSLFRCQIALDDQKAAAQTLDALLKYAQALPQLPDSEIKHGYFLVDAQAAARLGNQKLAAQCLKDAAKSIAPSFGGDTDLAAQMRQQDSQEVDASRALFLAQQGHPHQALAVLAAITEPPRYVVAFRYLFLSAIIRNDAPTAVAALAALGHPAKPFANPPEPNLIQSERLAQIPAVARLIGESLLTPQKNAPPTNPAKWIQSLPTPEERATAAIAIANTLLSPPPALPAPAEFP